MANILKFRQPDSINLSKKPLGVEGALEMQKGFLAGGGKILTELCLWSCGLGNEGVELVLSCLPGTVRTLWLDANEISQLHPESIAEPNFLQEVYLSSNRLGMAPAGNLIGFLKKAPFLLSLDLAANEIGGKRMENIFNYICGDETKPDYTLMRLSIQVYYRVHAVLVHPVHGPRPRHSAIAFVH